MKILHRDARRLVSMGFVRTFDREAERPEAQLTQAVGFIETGYAQFWKGEGIGSNNVGAVQAGASWTGATFSYTDTAPNADGTSTPYVTKFRKYPTLVDGFTDLVKRVLTGGRGEGREKLVQPAAKKGDLLAFSSGLFDTVYYEGFGRNREERIGHHVKALKNALVLMCREIGEPMPDGSALPRSIRVVRQGERGEHVRIIQKVVGAKDDGVFGRDTRAKVEAWQRSQRLKPDGVFGPVSYGEVVNDTGATLESLLAYLE